MVLFESSWDMISSRMQFEIIQGDGDRRSIDAPKSLAQWGTDRVHLSGEGVS